MLVWADTFWEERDGETQFGCRALYREVSPESLSRYCGNSGSSGGRKPGTHPTVKGCHGRRDGRPWRARGWTQLHESNPNPAAQSWPQHRIPAMMVVKAGVRGPLGGLATSLRLLRSTVTPAGSAQNHPSPYPRLPGPPHPPHPPSPPQSLTLQHLPQCLHPALSGCTLTTPCHQDSTRLPIPGAGIWLGSDRVRE